MSHADLSRAEAQERARLLSVEHYEVDLDVDSGEETFLSKTVVQFRCNEPRAETFIDIAPQDLLQVTLNGQAVGNAACSDRRLKLSGLQENNTLEILATFPYSNTGQGMHRFVDPVDGGTYVYSDMEPFNAHRVFPCFDQPDLKAKFDFTLKAPPGAKAISNMPCIQALGEGLGGVHKFATTAPMSTYITFVGAGPFHMVRRKHRNIDLGIYCRASLAQYLDPDEIFEVTAAGFDFFEDLFDYPYPFGGKYDQLFVPEFVSGAMENAGAVTIHEAYIFRSKVTDNARESRTETILHELSHMWFGDLVTMKWWDDLWLNESFATYISNYAMDKATKWKNAWTFFSSRWKAAAYLQDQLPTTHPIAADAPDIATAESNFDAISYAKGASVLKQLVAWVGEEPFIEGLKQYFKKHEFSNATLRDFLKVLERSSGRSLSEWSREWLETPGVNILSLESEIEDGRYEAARLAQEVVDDWSIQRSHRLGLGLYDFQGQGMVRRRYLEVDAIGQRTDVPELRGEKVPDLLLVNDEDLAYSRIRLDERSIKSLTTGLRLLEDSLARSLCWSAAWDMMRSAEVPARRYLDVVLNNIDTETDVGLAQTSIARMQTAIYLYVAPQNREEHLRRITDYALQGARSAEAGGDFQLNWFTTFVSLAKAPEHLKTLSQFLSGEGRLPGLDIDFARRWQIVMRLVAMGTAEEQLIASELEREPTDQAERNAETARTLVPTAAAKQTAWDTVVDHPETSRASVLAIATGFMHPEQTELLVPFVEPFFEVVESVWTSRPREVAEIFPLGFFPRLIIDQSVIDRCDRFLSEKDADPALERKLIEARESVARALKVREADEAYEDVVSAG